MHRYDFFFFFLLWVLSSCSGGLLVAAAAAVVPPQVIPPMISQTIVVDMQGHGNFRSIQAAVDSIPDGNRKWTLIHVKQGIYWGKVLIPSTKPYIVLEGEGYRKSVIAYNDFSTARYYSLESSNSSASAELMSDTMTCATFKVEANDFVARYIGFWNTYKSRKGSSRPAVAAFVGGDRNSFYGCSFVSYQDTLCDYRGRHYFYRCWIQGAVDFIFGFAQSIYESSFVHSTGPGWLTAQARVKQSDAGGFVFKYCNITADERTYLGRPWSQYATVVFYKSWMSAAINPLGWQAWNATQNTAPTTLAEAYCSGPGSNTNRRVPWMKHLTPRQLNHYVSSKMFIGPDDWTRNHP